MTQYPQLPVSVHPLYRLFPALSPIPWAPFTQTCPKVMCQPLVSYDIHIWLHVPRSWSYYHVAEGQRVYLVRSSIPAAVLRRFPRNYTDCLISAGNNDNQNSTKSVHRHARVTEFITCLLRTLHWANWNIKSCICEGRYYDRSSCAYLGRREAHSSTEVLFTAPVAISGDGNGLPSSTAFVCSYGYRYK